MVFIRRFIIYSNQSNYSYSRRKVFEKKKSLFVIVVKYFVMVSVIVVVYSVSGETKVKDSLTFGFLGVLFTHPSLFPPHLLPYTQCLHSPSNVHNYSSPVYDFYVYTPGRFYLRRRRHKGDCKIQYKVCELYSYLRSNPFVTRSCLNMCRHTKCFRVYIFIT